MLTEIVSLINYMIRNYIKLVKTYVNVIFDKGSVSNNR